MRVAGCYCLSALLRRPSSLRPASTETRVHAVAHTHTHAPRRTHPTHLPPAHAFLILLPLLMAEAFCSLLFPFSLSLSAPPFPFFNILFLSLHMQLASPSLPPPSLPSHRSPPARAASPSISSLSLLGACRARGHYLSHSGHVRWNGGERSEQQRSCGGRAACSKAHNAAQPSSFPGGNLPLSVSTPPIFCFFLFFSSLLAAFMLHLGV